MRYVVALLLLLGCTLLVTPAGAQTASQTASPPDETLPVYLQDRGIGVLTPISASAPSVGQLSSAPRSDELLPVYLRDRGTGIASSMFGTYIRKGDLIFYPYWEYYLDNNREYKPLELGYGVDQDFRGRYRESEYLFFVAYGLTDFLALQTELAYAGASLVTSPADVSGLPSKIDESGLTSFETQLRWRWRNESETRPELWGYVDVVYPINRKKLIIGSDGWDVEWGTGLTRGFSWGTLTARASVIYESASTSRFDVGEYGVEYLKRLSPSWRLFTAVQGAGDEVSLITEAQWHISRKVFIRFNQEIGLTSRANDWEPQLGVLFTLPTR